MDQARKINILLGLFVSSIIIANILGGKISYFNIFGLSIEFSVGLLGYPVAFLITDVIAEVKGRKVAKEFVFAGVASLVFILAIIALAVVLPYADRSWVAQGQFEAVFKSGMRMLIASIIAFFISQMHDVFAFEYIKKKTKGKFLWIRNNLSTMVSQGIDTFVFMFLAFYMATPDHTAGYVVALALPYYGLKILLSAIDTPFVYLGVRWLGKGQNSADLKN